MILGCEEDEIASALRSSAAIAVSRMLARQGHACMWDEAGIIGPVGRLP